MRLREMLVASGLSAVLALAPTAALHAQDTAARKATASDDPKVLEAPETIVCKRMPPPTGTRTGGSKKVCMTNLAWQQQRENANQTARDVQTRGSLGGRNN